MDEISQPENNDYLKLDEEIEEGAPPWVVSFSDMMTLLLCFFILLFAASSVQKDKFKRIVDSLTDAFGGAKTDKILDKEEFNIEHIMINKEEISEEYNNKEVQKIIHLEMLNIKKQVKKLILKNNLKEKVSVDIGARGTVITLSDVILFNPGRANMNQQGQKVMEKIFTILKQFNYHMRVEGHTDNIPIHTAQYPSNWELSTARACEIVRYLIKKGMNPQILSAEGYAEFRSLVSNNTSTGRAKNRRVEIIYVQEEMKKAVIKNIKNELSNK